jgi:predicted transport protein
LDQLQPLFQALGEDVVELPNERTVVYRVFDFFVEVIPRKQRLTLLLNLDFADCDDPTGKSRDATEFAFIIGATESGRRKALRVPALRAGAGAIPKTSRMERPRALLFSPAF